MSIAQIINILAKQNQLSHAFNLQLSASERTMIKTITELYETLISGNYWRAGAKLAGGLLSGGLTGVSGFADDPFKSLVQGAGSVVGKGADAAVEMLHSTDTRAEGDLQITNRKWQQIQELVRTDQSFAKQVADAIMMMQQTKGQERT